MDQLIVYSKSRVAQIDQVCDWYRNFVFCRKFQILVSNWKYQWRQNFYSQNFDFYNNFDFWQKNHLDLKK